MSIETPGESKRSPQSGRYIHPTAPLWARLWAEAIFSTDKQLPAGLVYLLVSGDLPEHLDGYTAPVATGNSHTRLHAPSVYGSGKNKTACSAPINGSYVNEHAAYNGTRDTCEKKKCRPYFAVLEQAGVIE